MNELARLMGMGRSPNALIDAARSQEYDHAPRAPLSSLRGKDALTDWALGVRERTLNPLQAAADYSQEFQNMTPEDQGMQLVGGGMQGVGGLLGATAWHGSPHLFDKFRKEAIGTGEGAQAYGHGLYLAESPDVAKSYITTQSQSSLGENASYRNYIGDKLLSSSDNPRGWESYAQKRAFDQLSNYDNNYDSALSSLRKDDLEAIAIINDAKLNNLKARTDGGNLYKTDIPDTHIDKMLDWDKPLSEQHPDVQDAIRSYYKKHTGTPEFAIEDSLKSKGFTGGDWYNEIQKQHFQDDFGKPTGLESAALNELGIPGIKYLDGSSRTAGEGTRNFVMFNPDDIRITERNGQPTGQQPWADDYQKLASDAEARIKQLQNK